ncbi:MAG: dienelactone hydrolase family protein [Bacteroidota bacterium]
MIREYLLPAKGMVPHIEQRIFAAGGELQTSQSAVIMIHGRGAAAQSILDISSYLPSSGVSYIAPQATNSVWYPYRFLEPIERNEPHLTSALQKIDDTIAFVHANGIPEEKIMLLGFSQGACLALHYAATRKRKLSAVFGLSGGLIGSEIHNDRYRQDLSGTTVFLGCSDTDFHIPKERVEQTGDVFRSLGADVTMRIYPNMDHTINDDEIEFIAQQINEMTVRE